MPLRILLIGLSLLLAACQTTPVIEQDPNKVSGTHGYVYVNFPKASFHNGVDVKNTKTGIEYTLSAREADSLRAYGLWLPAGEYRLSRWARFPLVNYTPFQVKPGHVTDLGSLITIDIGGHQTIVLPYRHPEYSDAIEPVLNQHGKHLHSKQPLQWFMKKRPEPVTITAGATGLGLVVDIINQHAHDAVKPSNNKTLKATTDIDEFFRIALTAIQPEEMEVAMDEAGNLYYGGDLGQIRVRNKTGQWSSLDTGSLKPVTAVEYHDGALYAGMLDGKIRITRDQGKTWRVLNLLDDKEAIVDIDKTENGWLIMSSGSSNPPQPSILFGVRRSVEEVILYQAIGQEPDNLVIVTKKKYPEGPFNVIPSINGTQVADDYYFFIYPELHRLSLSSGHIETFKLPNEPTAFSVSDDASVITVTRAQGIFSDLYISTDRGKTWKPLNTPPYHAPNIHFRSPNEGHTARWSAGAFTGNYEIYDYNAGEEKWFRTNEVPEGCMKILWDAHKEPAFCVSRSGTILVHKNNKWLVEYSNE